METMRTLAAFGPEQVWVLVGGLLLIIVTATAMKLLERARRATAAKEIDALKLAAQAEASKTLVSNVMGIAQQMVAAQVDAGQNEGTDDPMEKMARIFKMIAPAIGALGQGSNGVPPPQPQPQQRLVRAQ